MLAMSEAMFLSLAAVRLDMTMIAILMAAWFLQMGIHEGGHAYMAHRLGDRLPAAMGKLTFNPFRHIEWNNGYYVVSAVIMPLVTAMQFGFPLGMAWVQTSPTSTGNHAKIAIAGPLGNLVVVIVSALLIGLLFAFVPAQHLNTRTFMLLIDLLKWTGLVSVVYGAYNLIPFPPLDGGNVAYHFMNRDGREFFDKVRPYGFFILIAAGILLPSLTGGRFNPIGDMLGYAIEGYAWLISQITRMFGG